MKFLESSWRRQAAPIIEKVLRETEGQDEKVIRGALRAAYPFGERQYHPYKIWLDEIKRQRGAKWPIGHKRRWENQQAHKTSDRKRLEEWERLYGPNEGRGF
jgi:hypothetical protein